MKRMLAILLTLLLVLLASAAGAEEDILASRFGRIEVEWQGRTYRLKPQLETVLVLGTDRRPNNDLDDPYINGVQADLLLLIVVNGRADTVTPILINRDTMAWITKMDDTGAQAETVAQICLSHSYGNGGAESCDLTARAVSRLFLNIPVDHYYAVNMDGISAFNEFLGGVTVTVEDDFSQLDATLEMGKTVTLHGDQAEHFVRSRLTVGDGSNEARLRRQRQYAGAASESLRQMLREDVNRIGDLFDVMAPYTVTDMTRGRIINLAVQAKRYEIMPLRTLSGTNIMSGSGYVEFYPDEGAVEALALEVFFDEE